jgi:DNA-binding transcriptional regulator GbsR (MarR family)
MKLTSTTEKFILHWGEMGARWGISRSVAQIHALLMVSPEPLPADEIAETLDIARSAVSAGIKELQGWGLIRIVHHMGDRRDHFTTLDDVWEIFLLIMRERRRRELDPTVAVLRECAAEASSSKTIPASTLKRFADLAEFMELTSRWCERSQSLSPAGLKRLASLGDKVFKLLG